MYLQPFYELLQLAAKYPPTALFLQKMMAGLFTQNTEDQQLAFLKQSAATAADLADQALADRLPKTGLPSLARVLEEMANQAEDLQAFRKGQRKK